MILKSVRVFLPLIVVFALFLPSVAASELDAALDIKSMTLIHYKRPDNYSSPLSPLNNLYYELLGLELTSTFTYYVNPKFSGIESGAAVDQVQLSFNAWNATTEVRLFNFGGLTGGEYASDGQNTVSWARLDSNTKIAMTVIWYVPDTDGDGLEEIVEADIVLNSILRWGIDPDGEGPSTTKAYDIRNVATHEAGHVVGLAGLQNDAYRELTMYEFSASGQTNKISLEGGDVTGAQFLYGPRTSR